MKWGEALQDVVERAGGVQRIPEDQAIKVAQLFYDQEVYPRMQSLQKRMRQASFEALLWPASPPPEGMTWRVDTVKLSVYQPAEQDGMLGPLATISFDYRIALIWDGSAYTKEGRSNSVVFTLLDEPIHQVELWFQSFLENLGVKG